MPEPDDDMLPEYDFKHMRRKAKPEFQCPAGGKHSFKRVPAQAGEASREVCQKCGAVWIIKVSDDA